jgi:hypothetical protein
MFSDKLRSLAKRLPTTPSWCQFVDCFLKNAEKEKACYIMEMPPHVCFSCQHKHELLSMNKPQGSTTSGRIPVILEGSTTRRKSTKKRRKLNDKYRDLKKIDPTHQRTIDGALFFPDLGVLIYSDLHHFDSLSIAKQIGSKKDQVEQGLPHMNINPQNAFALEQEGCFPGGKPETIEMYHADCIVSYQNPKDPNITIKRCVEVIVIDSLKAASLTGSRKNKGCNWIMGSELSKAVEYLSAQQVKAAKNRGVDIIAIFATPFNSKGSLHAVTVRWLCAAIPKRSDQESSEVYLFLTNMLSKARG